MADTGSGPNIIIETFIPKGSISDNNNILKLNGINEYLVSRKNNFIGFWIESNFSVSNDFPISQSNILGNDLFEEFFKNRLREGIPRYIRNKNTLLVIRNHLCISTLGIFILRQNRKFRNKNWIYSKNKNSSWNLFSGNTIVENVWKGVSKHYKHIGRRSRSANLAS